MSPQCAIHGPAPILAGPYYSLYDLCHDPLERDDRAAAEPERVARMQTLLENNGYYRAKVDPARRSN